MNWAPALRPLQLCGNCVHAFPISVPAKTGTPADESGGIAVENMQLFAWQWLIFRQRNPPFPIPLLNRE